MTISRRGRLWGAVAGAVIVAASIAAVIVSTATASSGCEPIDFEIAESNQFTPVDGRLTSPPDPAINPAGELAAHVPPNARVPSIDGVPLRHAVTSSNGAVYQYFYNAEIDRSLTVSEFLGTGGIQFDRDPTDNAESYPEYVLSLGGRAVRVEVGDYVGALTWADPDSNGIRPHYLVWSDGQYNYSLIADMEPEHVLTLARELVCGGKLGV